MCNSEEKNVTKTSAELCGFAANEKVQCSIYTMGEGGQGPAAVTDTVRMLCDGELNSVYL